MRSFRRRNQLLSCAIACALPWMPSCTPAGGHSSDDSLPSDTMSEGAKTSRCTSVDDGETASLSCPSGNVITAINFASFGTPQGTCGGYWAGDCDDPNSKLHVELSCLNRPSCQIKANGFDFTDSCPDGTPNKKLSITYTCGTGNLGNTSAQTLAYYGTNAPSSLGSPPSDYTSFYPETDFGGGVDGIDHELTASPGAGKFIYNRIFRANKYGLDYRQQFGIFHW